MSPRTLTGIAFALATLLLAACGARGEPASLEPTPSGASQGLNTFIFFYTDG